MLAEEFQATVANGKIQIPELLMSEFEGCEVRVIVLKTNKKKSLPFDLRKLFQNTQILPQVQSISENEIIAEIDNYRQGR
ncbi:hypothetical protein [Pseudanabaena sp. ABRG5-3]|uniref:hypothetical protein n=1 Tax=Pseudanabaena sp. ABRG5-3 TaxID=685565 RepID=UPI000DC7274C|nr:hypothetical protein [Pseudanabaena sp. ABRG5-3]BBC23572.1 hypothetical protein ABRG53_1315 [Pseudanabaena sp. ABRG5-3]